MEIAPRTHLIDVHYLGRAGGIAACVMETDSGLAVVDPGPTSSLAGLRDGMRQAGLDPAAIRFLLLTHIHLDHAGAAGTLVRETPDVRVYVHERGAVHLEDPSRLMASAVRIYGSALGRLFGEFNPVPADAIVPLSGGEVVDVGGRRLRVTYTPGHASHHVAWLDEGTGIAFLGDTAGERFAQSSCILPVTPPPDIDLEAWRNSIAAVREWRARSLFITHFGTYTDVDAHFDALEAGLQDWAARVRRSLDEAGSDEERAARFETDIRAVLARDVEPSALQQYLEGGGIRDSWYGLARYWRKRT